MCVCWVGARCRDDQREGARCAGRWARGGGGGALGVGVRVVCVCVLALFNCVGCLLLLPTFCPYARVYVCVRMCVSSACLPVCARASSLLWWTPVGTCWAVSPPLSPRSCSMAPAWHVSLSSVCASPPSSRCPLLACRPSSASLSLPPLSLSVCRCNGSTGSSAGRCALRGDQHLGLAVPQQA